MQQEVESYNKYPIFSWPESYHYLTGRAKNLTISFRANCLPLEVT